MIRLKFAIHDSKANSFIEDFTSPTRATAIRSFEAAANTEGNQFNTYAADYTLFFIGHFDDETAELSKAPNGNENLGSALSYIKTPPALALAGA